jgi:CopG family transcriptional regulator, nickel-responsive regulator
MGVAEAEGTTKRTDAKQARRRALVSRTSLSLPEDLLLELDAMVSERGFANRSQAVSKLLHRSLVAQRHEVGDRVMVGTVTLFYDNKTAGLRERLAQLQRDNIAEVISSLHVHLEENQTLEVVLVQGPALKLQQIADELIAQKGIISGHLELVAALIPQVHPHRSEEAKRS